MGGCMEWWKLKVLSCAGGSSELAPKHLQIIGFCWSIAALVGKRSGLYLHKIADFRVEACGSHAFYCAHVSPTKQVNMLPTDDRGHWKHGNFNTCEQSRWRVQQKLAKWDHEGRGLRESVSHVTDCKVRILHWLSKVPIRTRICSHTHHESWLQADTEYIHLTLYIIYICKRYICGSMKHILSGVKSNGIFQVI